MAIDWKGLAYRLRLQKRNLEDQLADMSLAFLDERARTTVLERQIAALQAVADARAADHPWFTWLPPTASVHRQCCDRPQSKHPPGDIVATLDQAGAALVETGDAMVDDLDMLLFGGIELKPTDDGPVTFEAMLHLMQMMALHCDVWRRARGLDGEGE
jgi:hypothetical protein